TVEEFKALIVEAQTTGRHIKVQLKVGANIGEHALAKTAQKKSVRIGGQVAKVTDTGFELLDNNLLRHVFTSKSEVFISYSDVIQIKRQNQTGVTLKNAGEISIMIG